MVEAKIRNFARVAEVSIAFVSRVVLNRAESHPIQAMHSTELGVRDTLAGGSLEAASS